MHATVNILSHGQITSEGIQRLRALIGHEMRHSFRFNTEVTYDNVRQFCWGVGDGNPLWLDPDYGSAMPNGARLAPPAMLWTIHPTWVQIGLPGVHGFFAGSTWTFFRPVQLGDRPKPTIWLDDVVEKPSTFGRKAVILYFRTIFADAQDRLIAEVRSWSFRIERTHTDDRNADKHAGLAMKRWTPDEIAPIEEAQLQEAPRGSDLRYWDDISPGDEVDQILKGPLCLTDMIAWYVGAQPLYQPAHRLALQHYERHPKWAYRNPEIGNLEPNVRVHEDIAAARSAGLPGPYDLGMQRHQWLFHLLTDWCGDDGFVKTCSAQYRAFNFYGDVLRLGGQVVAKHVDDDGDHVVELQVWARNQRGKDVMPGRAVIALPTEDGSRPIADHLAKEIDATAFRRSLVPDFVPLGPATAS